MNKDVAPVETVAALFDADRKAVDSFLKRAKAIYDLGVERLFFWDTNARYHFDPSWSVLRGLGHKDNPPAPARPGKKLLKLGDWDLTYATPG